MKVISIVLFYLGDVVMGYYFFNLIILIIGCIMFIFCIIMMIIFFIFYNKCLCKNKKSVKKENGNVFKLKNKDFKMFIIN